MTHLETDSIIMEELKSTTMRGEEPIPLQEASPTIASGREPISDEDEGPEDEIKLSSKKRRALLGLMVMSTVGEAAQFANVGTRTLHRWLKDPDFAAALRDANRAAFAHSITRLNQLLGSAVSALADIVNDQSAPPSARLRAAEKIFALTKRSITLDIE